MFLLLLFLFVLLMKAEGINVLKIFMSHYL